MPNADQFQIVAIYAALLGLMFVALSILTIRARGSAGVSLGAGEDEDLLRRIRAHGNFAEYVPIALILIAAMIVTGAETWYLHLACLLLIAGRLVHAASLYRRSGRLRVIGMAATFVVIIGVSGRILVGVAG